MFRRRILRADGTVNHVLMAVRAWLVYAVVFVLLLLLAPWELAVGWALLYCGYMAGSAQGYGMGLDDADAIRSAVRFRAAADRLREPFQ